MNIHVTPAGQNIFEELGFDSETARNLKIRANLMIAIRQIVKGRRLKQTAAASLFGTTQPRISDVMRGEIDEFTIDSLVNMLSHAGVDVELSLEGLASLAGGWGGSEELADSLARRDRDRRPRSGRSGADKGSM